MIFRAIGLLLCGGLLVLATTTASLAASKKGLNKTECAPGVLTCRKAGKEQLDRMGGGGGGKGAVQLNPQPEPPGRTKK